MGPPPPPHKVPQNSCFSPLATACSWLSGSSCLSGAEGHALGKGDACCSSRSSCLPAFALVQRVKPELALGHNTCLALGSGHLCYATECCCLIAKFWRRFELCWNAESGEQGVWVYMVSLLPPPSHEKSLKGESFSQKNKLCTICSPFPVLA